MATFPKEAAQYDWAKLSLHRYIEEYETNPDWELVSSVRRDTWQRARLGQPTKKMVYMRRPKDLAPTVKQIASALTNLNSRNPYSLTSYYVIKAVNSIVGKFSAPDVAFIAFGPSDKEYEKGANEQNVKRIVFRMRDDNLLGFKKRKFHKLPAWIYFWQEVEILYQEGKFRERGINL